MSPQFGKAPFRLINRTLLVDVDRCLADALAITKDSNIPTDIEHAERWTMDCHSFDHAMAHGLPS